MAENLQTSQVIAKIFGVSTRRVEQLKTEGIIKGQGKPTKYDLLPTIQAYIRYLSDKANGREKKETDSQLETEKLTAEKRIKMAKAEMKAMSSSICSPPLMGALSYLGKMIAPAGQMRAHPMWKPSPPTMLCLCGQCLWRYRESWRWTLQRFRQPRRQRSASSRRYMRSCSNYPTTDTTRRNTKSA